MTLFTKESLEQLRTRVDLVDLVGSHIELKRAGGSYKARCPFHDEKSPSFVIQRGDDHYHCYGCGAHGDAIQFLMAYLKLSFVDSVEALAQRYHVVLDRQEEGKGERGPSKTQLKELLEQSCRFFHFYLLHTAEGHTALHYLYQRGLSLNFIRRFQIGLAPREEGVMRRYLGAPEELLTAAGLLSRGRDFYRDRITFPLRDPSGAVIGFSARKYQEETYGGKYINSTETVLFKKSQFLFGLSDCRRRIAKEQKAIVVEGQVDALRLIEAGFNLTVAALGTAFGEGHVEELRRLGVLEVYLAMDGDEAGREAAAKIGNLFQRVGVEVSILPIPVGEDPDSLLNERGPDGFLDLLEEKQDYLSFLIAHLSRQLNVNSPAGKNELVDRIAKQVRSWENPVMVHESLRRLAQLTRLPEEVVGIGTQPRSQVAMRQDVRLGEIQIDPDRILEEDFLRWLLLMGEQERFCQLAESRLSPDRLKVDRCRQIYAAYLDCYRNRRSRDLLSLAMQLDIGDGQLALSEILKKRVNPDRAEDQFPLTIQKILERNWMEEREGVKQQIQRGEGGEEELFALLKEFDRLKSKPPEVKWAT
jgi:DNA primase